MRSRKFKAPKINVPSGDDEGKYTEQFKESLKRAKEDINCGRLYSHQEIKKILKIRKCK